MEIVVTDTGPPHYLVLIGAIHLLPGLFGSVLVPEIVVAELSHRRTPPAVRAWVTARPAWLMSRPTLPVTELPLPKLDDGERAAIALARAVGATQLLTDDRAATVAAREGGLRATGTIGLLVRAATEGLIELPVAFDRLLGTNFRYPPGLLDALLAEHQARSSGR